MDEGNGPMPNQSDVELDERCCNCPLDYETMEILRQVAEWWSTRPGQVGAKPSGRLAFLGPKANSGIRVSRPLLDAALAKFLTDRPINSASLSGMIEFLLWHYLDFDDSLLKKPDET